MKRAFLARELDPMELSLVRGGDFGGFSGNGYDPGSFGNAIAANPQVFGNPSVLSAITQNQASLNAIASNPAAWNALINNPTAAAAIVADATAFAAIQAIHPEEAAAIQARYAPPPPTPPPLPTPLPEPVFQDHQPMQGNDTSAPTPVTAEPLAHAPAPEPVHDLPAHLPGEHFELDPQHAAAPPQVEERRTDASAIVDTHADGTTTTHETFGDGSYATTVSRPDGSYTVEHVDASTLKATTTEYYKDGSYVITEDGLGLGPRPIDAYHPPGSDGATTAPNDVRREAPHVPHYDAFGNLPGQSGYDPDNTLGEAGVRRADPLLRARDAIDNHDARDQFLLVNDLAHQVNRGEALSDGQLAGLQLIRETPQTSGTIKADAYLELKTPKGPGGVTASTKFEGGVFYSNDAHYGELESGLYAGSTDAVKRVVEVHLPAGLSVGAEIGGESSLKSNGHGGPELGSVVKGELGVGLVKVGVEHGADGVAVSGKIAQDFALPFAAKGSLAEVGVEVVVQANPNGSNAPARSLADSVYYSHKKIAEMNKYRR